MKKILYNAKNNEYIIKMRLTVNRVAVYWFVQIMIVLLCCIFVSVGATCLQRNEYNMCSSKNVAISLVVVGILLLSMTCMVHRTCGYDCNENDERYTDAGYIRAGTIVM